MNTLRFVTQKMHALLDYPIVAILMGLPFLLNLGTSNPAAKWLSVGAGIAALILTIFTNHETGLIKLIPYSIHVTVDRLVGVTFLLAPFILGFHGLDMFYYLANGAAVLTVTTLLNRDEQPVL